MFDKTNFTAVIDQRLQRALDHSFVAMRDASAADHGSYMRRCQLELLQTDAAKLPTPERLKRVKQTQDPALEALYFQFGRHLMVAGSRPDSPLPAKGCPFTVDCVWV
ncbi:hypothetical protein KBB96_07105 [Luteolibacter ambystomatis]|uniref:Glycosyl hydrolase family 95 catalytic domain-containing protein n=1 Tax=Luteolibacter ambystomatis TaxID=2824561 RepID=A0A975J296_9BACT|nr:hypothetical protein [Luteolibacter ambystomatis]QUE52656.1 hypothetical protein KBB96_07105 [Luteolibacter ambystomatis]